MRAADRGYVLIEALVATAVVAMILAALFAVAADSARRVDRVRDTRAALMIARSTLASVGVAIPLAAGSTSGVDGDYEWRVEIERYPAPVTQAGVPMRVAARVVRPARPPLATLVTLRLAPPPPTP